MSGSGLVEKVVLAIIGVSALIIFAPMLGVLGGAFAGWVVSYFAPVWVPNGLALIGIHVTPNQLVELGAGLGFLSGFLARGSAWNNKK